MPHVHFLLWLIPEHRITPDKIDDIVCAEIPDPTVDPELHAIVIAHMVHGSCGSINPGSSCMAKGHCTKQYPKTYVNATQLGADI